MGSIDISELRAAAEAKVAGTEPPGPCNRRCRDRGECAFGRAEENGKFCRVKRRQMPGSEEDQVRRRA